MRPARRERDRLTAVGAPARLAAVAPSRDNARMSDFLDQRRDVLARHLRRHLAGEVRFDVATRALYSTDANIYQIEPHIAWGVWCVRSGALTAATRCRYHAQRPCPEP